MAYGMYKVGTFNIKRRGWKQEKLEARRTLVPYLQVSFHVCMYSCVYVTPAAASSAAAAHGGWRVWEGIRGSEQRIAGADAQGQREMTRTLRAPPKRAARAPDIPTGDLARRRMSFKENSLFLRTQPSVLG